MKTLGHHMCGVNMNTYCTVWCSLVCLLMLATVCTLEIGLGKLDINVKKIGLLTLKISGVPGMNIGRNIGGGKKVVRMRGLFRAALI